MLLEVKYGISYYRGSGEDQEIKCNSLEELNRVSKELNEKDDITISRITTYVVLDGNYIEVEVYHPED